MSKASKEASRPIVAQTTAEKLHGAMKRLNYIPDSAQVRRLRPRGRFTTERAYWSSFPQPLVSILSHEEWKSVTGKDKDPVLEECLMWDAFIRNFPGSHRYLVQIRELVFKSVFHTETKSLSQVQFNIARSGLLPELYTILIKFTQETGTDLLKARDGQFGWEDFFEQRGRWVHEGAEDLADFANTRSVTVPAAIFLINAVVAGGELAVGVDEFLIPHLMVAIVTLVVASVNARMNQPRISEKRAGLQEYVAQHERSHKYWLFLQSSWLNILQRSSEVAEGEATKSPLITQLQTQSVFSEVLNFISKHNFKEDDEVFEALLRRFDLSSVFSAAQFLHEAALATTLQAEKNGMKAYLPDLSAFFRNLDISALQKLAQGDANVLKGVYYNSPLVAAMTVFPSLPHMMQSEAYKSSKVVGDQTNDGAARILGVSGEVGTVIGKHVHDKQQHGSNSFENQALHGPRVLGQAFERVVPPGLAAHIAMPPHPLRMARFQGIMSLGVQFADGELKGGIEHLFPSLDKLEKTLGWAGYLQTLEVALADIEVAITTPYSNDPEERELLRKKFRYTKKLLMRHVLEKHTPHTDPDAMEQLVLNGGHAAEKYIRVVLLMLEAASTAGEVAIVRKYIEYLGPLDPKKVSMLLRRTGTHHTNTDLPSIWIDAFAAITNKSLLLQAESHNAQQFGAPVTVQATHSERAKVAQEFVLTASDIVYSVAYEHVIFLHWTSSYPLSAERIQNCKDQFFYACGELSREHQVLLLNELLKQCRHYTRSARKVILNNEVGSLHDEKIQLYIDTCHQVLDLVYPVQGDVVPEERASAEQQLTGLEQKVDAALDTREKRYTRHREE